MIEMHHAESIAPDRPIAPNIKGSQEGRCYFDSRSQSSGSMEQLRKLQKPLFFGVQMLLHACAPSRREMAQGAYGIGEHAPMNSNRALSVRKRAAH